MRGDSWWVTCNYLWVIDARRHTTAMVVIWLITNRQTSHSNRNYSDISVTWECAFSLDELGRVRIDCTQHHASVKIEMTFIEKMSEMNVYI